MQGDENERLISKAFFFVYKNSKASSSTQKRVLKRDETKTWSQD